MPYAHGRMTIVPRTGPFSASCALATTSWYQRGKSSACGVSTRAIARHYAGSMAALWAGRAAVRRSSARPRCRGRLQRGAQQRRQGAPEPRLCRLTERLVAEQAGAEAGVGEVGEQRAVADLHELDGVVRAQPAGLGLAREERHGVVQERPHVRGDRLLEPLGALDRLAADDDHEVEMLGEELKARRDERLDLVEALQAGRPHAVRRGRPVAYGFLDDGRVQAFLGAEVVEQRRVREPGALGDVLQTRVGEAVFGELPAGDGEDARVRAGRRCHLLTR